MRLIDADKLKIRNVSADYWYTVMGVTENDIDYADTVDAIPIEWIINWLTKQTIPALHTCDDYDAVNMMLNDWEKENEQDGRTDKTSK